MKNKSKIYFLLALLPMIILSSCGKFADEYVNNPDPNVNSTGNTAMLLSDALNSSFNGNGIVYGDNESAFLVQYTSEFAYPGFSLYNNNNSEWNIFYANGNRASPITPFNYAGPLMDLKYIIDYNTNTPTASNVVGNGSNKNQLATARIWKAYLFSIVTDKWGDVPYFEANSTTLTPKYDTQKDIYTDIFKELTEAVDQFDGGTTVIGDILFGGDVIKWKKFANSLRMVLALRLSKIDPATGKAQFLAAYNHSAGYISNNAESAYFNYLGDINFYNPWYYWFFEFNAIGISNTVVDMLQTNQDPRLDSMATTDKGGGITGLTYGLNLSDIQAFSTAHPNSYSLFSPKFTSRDSKGYFMTASQMLLTRAEAGLLGWITTTPKDDYENAIKLSMQQVGVTDATLITACLTNTHVAYNTTSTDTALQQIATQKYIALFPNSVEAYSEWRRTGFPKLTPAPDAINLSKQIPRRFGYPLLEATLNTANNTAALNRMNGTNSTDNRVWWDKK